MKTPKDILFARHRPVDPKLDTVRREVVATIRDRGTPAPKPAAVTDRRQNETGWWRQLICPGPQAWAGLAAVWILIFALKLSTHDESHASAKNSSMPPAAVAELRQQQLLFAELIGLHVTSDAEPPKTSTTRPRSERRGDTVLV